MTVQGKIHAASSSTSSRLALGDYKAGKWTGAVRTGLSPEPYLVQSIKCMLQRILVLEMVVEKPVGCLGKVRIQFKGMR